LAVAALNLDAFNSYKFDYTSETRAAKMATLVGAGIEFDGSIVHIKGRYHTHRGDPLRTNIVLDEELVREAQKLTALPTKKAVVDEALRTLIRLKKQQTILSLRGKVQWRGDLNASRTGRHRANDH